MDHISLHSDSYSQPLIVPYICGGDFEYDHRGFAGFPNRAGVVPMDIVQGKLDKLNQSDALAFFQSWCFFGLLSEFLAVVGRSFTVTDFVQEELAVPSTAVTPKTVSTKQLPLLARDLEEESRKLPSSEKLRRFETICKSLQVAADFTHLSTICNVDAEGRHFYSDDSTNWEEVPSLGNVVHLSIVALGEFLWATLLSLYGPRPRDCTIDLGPSFFVQSRMIRAGWCPNQVRVLDEQKTGVSLMYYMSSMNAHVLGWNHGECCDRFKCRFDALDLQRYQTKHFSECKVTGTSDSRNFYS